MDQCSKVLTDKLLNIAKQISIPKFKDRRTQHKLDDTLSNLIKSKKAIEQKLMKPSLRTDHHDDLSSQLSTINAAIVERQKELNSEEEEKVVSQIKSNTKVFFSYASKKRKFKTSIGPLKSGNTFESGPKKMATILNNQFEAMFSEN